MKKKAKLKWSRRYFKTLNTTTTKKTSKLMCLVITEKMRYLLNVNGKKNGKEINTFAEFAKKNEE